MDDLFDRIRTAARFIEARSAVRPATGIILGTGLGGLADAIDIDRAIPYAEIPWFPASTVKGHSGQLILGTLADRTVIAMAGRFHYYEGYSMEELTFPVRVMKALGTETLMISNAAGGMNPAFSVGDMMLIRDHINLMPEHPLRGKNDERLGVRFPDMSEPYCPLMISRAQEMAAAAGLRLHTGIYAGVQGPTFETRAEYEYLRRIGADAVGMSTVPEVIVAVHAGMKVFALSVITDLGLPAELTRITHEEVLEAAARTAPLMTRLFEQMIVAEGVNS
jgi:purine-nucleoside phosphorylase